LREKRASSFFFRPKIIEISVSGQMSSPIGCAVEEMASFTRISAAFLSAATFLSQGKTIYA
jgi:hypothetical protein